jgi:DNA-directed RNA polymerase subunit RPC12/RpoP
MKKKKAEHTHQYRRVTTPKSTVFRCVLPGCRHYLRPEFAEGAYSLCPRCGGQFVLNSRNMKLENPHCDECTYRRNQSEEIERIKELLNKKIS